MSLQAIFNTKKVDGYIIPRLDKYLLTQTKKDADRRWDINSPSMASQCNRAIYYSRKGVERDYGSIDPRTQRIFDNGTGVHERLQRYMLEEGILLMDEVPVYDTELQIQGHTDGILRLSPVELGVLEIKSINSNAFSKLIDAKEEHKVQAQIYMMCLEAERKRLRELCKSKNELNSYLKSKECYDYYKNMYKHLKSGSKHSKQEKMDFQINLHLEACVLLWETKKSIANMVFLYENKDTQELKEFVVKWDEELIRKITRKLKHVNRCLKRKKIPKREGTSKSCSVCHWCAFKGECWVV